jgi:hypothetical protein
MKLLAIIILPLLLSGCFVTRDKPITGAPVASVMGEQGQLARAAVGAARAVNQMDANADTKAVIELELSSAESLLPTPTGAQAEQAQARANRALTATPEERTRIYAALQNQIAELEKKLVRAQIEEAKRAEAESGRREALMLQTRVTTYAGIGFMAIGVVLGFVGNIRLGAMTMAIGGVLLASSRIIATVPDWAYTVLFISAGLLALLTPLAMWWAYRAGLWQKPKCAGEYAVAD